VTDWCNDLDRLGQLASPRAVVVGSAPAKLSAPTWYDIAWNPTAGCSPVSPGCDHCEAMRIVAQLARMGGKGGARYAGLTLPGRLGPEWSGELRVRDDLLTWPLAQRKARRILVDSLSDLFHERLTTEAVDAVHAVIRIAHWHRFLIQTRRAARMRAYYSDPQTPQRIAVQIERLATGVVPARVVDRKAAAAVAALGTGIGAWPLPNLLLGVSVEDQKRVGRIGTLLQTPAALRWACFEPLLGPVRTDCVPVGAAGYVDALSGHRFDIDRRGRLLAMQGPALPALDWVVAGGEIGPAARPAIPNWVRDLRDGCAVAGVRFFFKQWGEWGPAPGNGSGEDVVRCGRRTAGRLIDGRSWDEMPSALRQRARLRRAPLGSA
jgi:protein gp37